MQKNKEIQKSNLKAKIDNTLKSYSHQPIHLHTYMHLLVKKSLGLCNLFPIKFIVSDLFVENQGDQWCRSEYMDASRTSCHQFLKNVVMLKNVCRLLIAFVTAPWTS